MHKLKPCLHVMYIHCIRMQWGRNPPTVCRAQLVSLTTLIWLVAVVRTYVCTCTCTCNGSGSTCYSMYVHSVCKSCIQYVRRYAIYVYVHIVCQQVTFVGRLGAAREKARVILGSFYGRPAVDTAGSPLLPPALLYSLEERLLSEYYNFREHLLASLSVFGSACRHEEQAAMPTSLSASLTKQYREAVLSHYHQCFRTQVRE